MIFTSRVCIASLLFVVFIACSEKKDIPASNFKIAADSLISPENMILILADVHVVEAAMLLERNEVPGSKANPDYYYRGIFEKYHLSADRYDQNMSFYRQNPENFEKMYEKVILVLENRQKKFSGGK